MDPVSNPAKSPCGEICTASSDMKKTITFCVMWWLNHLVKACPALICMYTLLLIHPRQDSQRACIKNGPRRHLSPSPGVMNRVNWMYSLIMERTKSQSDSLVKVLLQRHRGKQLSLINQREDTDLRWITENIKERNIGPWGPETINHVTVSDRQ